MIKRFPLFIFFLLQVNLFPKVSYKHIISERVSIHNQYANSVYSDSSSNKSVNIQRDSLGMVSDSLYNNKLTKSSPSNDSLALLSGTKKANIDSVTLIFQSPVSNNSIILGSDNLRKNDYRYTPDFLKLFEFTWLAETGNLGFPDQLFLYGLPIYLTNYL